MKIPQAPGQLDNSNSRPQRPVQGEPVALSDLRLTTGKAYQGKVIGPWTPTDANASSANREVSAEALKQSSLDITNQVGSKPLQTTISSDKNALWLIRVNGQVIAIRPEGPLQTGDLLTLVQRPDGNLHLLERISHSNTGDSANIASTSALLNRLAQSMGQLLPRQITLEQGLAELQNMVRNSESGISQQARIALIALLRGQPGMNPQGNASSTVQTPALNATGQTDKLGELIAKVRANNSNAFPTSSASPSTSPGQENVNTSRMPSDMGFKQIAPETIRQMLQQSGLFMESNAQKAAGPPGERLGQQIRQTAQLAQLFQSSTAPANTSALGKGNSGIRLDQIPLARLVKLIQQDAQVMQSSVNQRQPDTNASGRDFRMQAGSSVLDTLIRQVLTQSQTSSPTKSLSAEFVSGKTLTLPGSAEGDLKSRLIGLIQALTRGTPGTSTEPASYPKEALTSPDLLRMPFNFPPPPMPQLGKVESMLADQEMTTGKILKLLAGMLNRIQFNQMNSLFQSRTASADGNPVQSWFFELPIMLDSQQMQPFQLRIDQEEEAESRHGDERRREIKWRLTLSFDMDALGAIYVEVDLTPPRLASQIWTSREETTALVNSELPLLTGKLEQLGLEVEKIDCKQGQPVSDTTRLDRSMVDIKA